MTERFVSIESQKNILERLLRIEKMLLPFTVMHCKLCGDTSPKHGFYPLLSTTIGLGEHHISSLTCNRCALSDEQYEQIFKEPKEVIRSFEMSGDKPINDRLPHMENPPPPPRKRIKENSTKTRND